MQHKKTLCSMRNTRTVTLNCPCTSSRVAKKIRIEREVHFIFSPLLPPISKERKLTIQSLRLFSVTLWKNIETFETELGVCLWVSCISQTCSNAGRQAAWRQHSRFLTGSISSNINHNIILWTWRRCSL